MGDIGISGGIDDSLCKDGLPAGFTFRDDSPNDISLHNRRYCRTVENRQNPCFLNECIRHDFE